MTQEPRFGRDCPYFADEPLILPCRVSLYFLIENRSRFRTQDIRLDACQRRCLPFASDPDRPPSLNSSSHDWLGLAEVGRISFEYSCTATWTLSDVLLTD